MSSSGTSFKRVKPHRFPKRRRLRASPRITWMEVNQLNPFEQNNRQKMAIWNGAERGGGGGVNCDVMACDVIQSGETALI